MNWRPIANKIIFFIVILNEANCIENIEWVIMDNIPLWDACRADTNDS